MSPSPRLALLAVLAAAILGGGAWLLARRASAPPVPAGTEAASGDDVPAPRPAPTPGLAKRDDEARARRAALASRGRSEITGVVRRDGAPTAAEVELRFQDPAVGEASGLQRVGDWLALVLAASARRPPDATAKAGADGRYTFAGRGRGTYEVFARTTDGARGAATAEVPADGARVEQDVAVAVGGETLSGRVRYADGRAFRGTVIVKPAHDGYAWLELDADSTTTTDDGGRFVAKGLPRGKVVVEALVPGVSRASGRPVSVPYDGAYELVVDEGAVRVEGRVLAAADDQPVGGASVGIATGSQGRSLIVLGAADAEGAFRFDLPMGAFTLLVVHAPGFAPKFTDDADLTKPVVVKLEKSGRVEGRVFSAADGTPVAGAVVRVTRGDAEYDRLGGGGTATTDTAGRYALEDVAPGVLKVSAVAPGWIEAERAAGEPKAALPTLAPAGSVVVDLRLARSASIAGRVVDAKGVPVAGAVVRAQVELPVVSASEPFAPEEPTFSDPETEPVASDAAGDFVVEGLRPASAYFLRASAPAAGPGKAGPVTLPAEGTRGVEIRLTAPRFVDVTVLDDGAGTPVEGVAVEARTVDEAGDTDRIDASWTTGRDGRARVGPLPPAMHRLSATRDEYLDGEVEVAATDASAVIRLRRGGVVSGRVTRPDGSAAAGASVSCTVRSPESWIYRQAECEPDGAFRLTGLPDGSLQVNASETIAGREARATAWVEAGASGVALGLSLASTAEPELGIVVRVVDGRDQPVPAAHAALRIGAVRSTADVVKGRVVFSGFDPTAGFVEVWDARGSDGAPLPLGPGRAEVAAEKEQEVLVRLPPERTITGFVRDEEGRAVPGVSLAVKGAERDDNGPPDEWRDVFPEETSRSEAIPTSAADGSFRIGGLGEGDYRIRALRRADFVPTASVAARGGASGVVVPVLRGIAVTVTVVDAAGKPVKGALVQAAPDESYEEMASWYSFRRAGIATDGAGALRVGGLVGARTYALVVTPPERRDDLLPRVVRSWRPKDDTVRLEPGFTLRGVVRDATGKPVPSARVQRKDADGDWTDERAEDDGRFRLERLPMVSVVVRARVGGWGEGGRVGPEVTVPAGSGPVVLTVDPGLSLTVRLKLADDAGYVRVDLLRESADRREEIDSSYFQDGKARFVGLSSGETYAVWVASRGDDRYALRTGVAAGGEAALEWTQGKSIAVRVKGPAAARPELEVRARARGIEAGGVRVGDGLYEVRGLPEGPWRVLAWAPVDGESWSAVAEVAAGGSVELELKRAPVEEEEEDR